MKNSNNKKNRINSSILLKMISYSVIPLFSIVSCSRIYDNVEKYADGEIIYVEQLDGIIRIQVGYERVEIDLLRAGRIPASQIRSNKAARTVIECEDFTEPGNRRVIDSLCSWVNVTGLTQLKNYRLTIYTEDQHGNRSLPLFWGGKPYVDVRPYTAENLQALQLMPPTVIESTSAALLEWKNPLSVNTHRVYRYEWQYADRDNFKQTGGGKGDVPSFFVENVVKNTEVPVTFTCRIIPTVSNFDGTYYIYTPILDTVDWKPTFNLRISENADPAIFLKDPANFAEFETVDAVQFPITFSWVKSKEVNRYALKFSTDRNFPAATTYTVDVGDVGEYEVDLVSLVNTYPWAHLNMFWWTVTPAEQTVPVTTQSRKVSTRRFEPTVIDVSTFSTVNADVVYSKLAFKRGGKIIVQGMSASQFEQEYNRDFFIKYPGDVDFYFNGADGEWDIFYSAKYQYFYVVRTSDEFPACIWGVGNGNSSPIHHSDFNSANWDFDAFWRLVYFRLLDNGRYQATVFLSSNLVNPAIQIYKARDWATQFSPLSISGDIAGMWADPPYFFKYNSDANFVQGYYRLTYDAGGTRDMIVQKME